MEGRSRPRIWKRGVFVDLETGRPVRPVAFVLCLLAAIGGAAWFQSDPGLSPAAHRALFILLLAVLLWVTEVVPAFAVGILVIALNIALLGRPDGVFARTDTDWEQFVRVLGHPLIWLFFGGFVLAAGMEKCGLDRRLAVGLLSRVGSGYRSVLLATMLATFVLSMFMSNTATTAMMLAIMTPLLRELDGDTRAAKGLLLGITSAANLGGLGSLIGTPPNAIAVAALAKLEPRQDVSFLDWMILGCPPALVSLFLVWFILLALFPSTSVSIALPSDDAHRERSTAPRWQFVVVVLCLVGTIGLWLTSQWHAIPTAAVSFLPIVLLTSTGILSAQDVRGLNYDVLFLMAGGLALGQMVTGTGLSEWIIAYLPVSSLGPLGLVALMTTMTVVMSNFMSNTAAANILIPLGVSMATGTEALIALGVAFGASSAMCLPVATPPNAMVFATGRLQTADLLKVGLVVGVITPVLGIAWALFCLRTFVTLGP